MDYRELIIGDWLLDKEEGFARRVVQVTDAAFDGCGAGVILENGMDYQECEPIPLTAEILEKNGFYKQKWSDLVTEYSYVTDLDKSPQTVIQYTIYSKEIEGVKSLCKIWTKSQYGNGQNDCHICGLYYVHELQHALKLCGIDKEIVCS